MTKVVIFGTGTFSDVVKYYLENDGRYEIVAFTSSNAEMTEYQDLPHVSFQDVIVKYPPSENSMFIAVGYRKMNSIRERFYNEAKELGYKLITYIHPNVIRWPNVTFGDNCFIFEDNTIQPFVTIGNNVVLWSGNHIGHHASVGDHTFISSHVVVSGQVKIGKNCFIGVNTSVRDGIEIADRNLIGAGAIIMKSTKENQAYVSQRTEPYSKTVDQIEF